jgi:AraC-like DNA-binding protein
MRDGAQTMRIVPRHNKPTKLHKLCRANILWEEYMATTNAQILKYPRNLDPGFGTYCVREEKSVSTGFYAPADYQYGTAGIGFVMSGWFDYRGHAGAATCVPGTLLFANRDEYFSVNHLDASGTRRLVAWYDNAFLEQIAEAYGLDKAEFQAVALPPGKSASNAFAWMRAMAAGSGDAEDAACSLATAALTANEEHHGGQAASPRERQRILSAVRHVGESYCEPCPVDALARISGFSRFRFMRLFKAVTGQSVNQYVINIRLHAAMARLIETKAPIGEIALDVGFNDISYFNNCFRAAFASTPRLLRKRMCAG